MYDRDEAAQLFVEALYQLYRSVIADMWEGLSGEEWYKRTPAIGDPYLRLQRLHSEERLPVAEEAWFTMSNLEPELTALSEWFQTLSETDKTHLYQVIRHTVHATLFHLCTLFDGVSGLSSPAIDAEADFAVYLQVYPDFDALFDGHPIQYAVRINPHAGGTGEMLHDLFQEMVGLVVDSTNEELA
jgi:hypothetical protein